MTGTLLAVHMWQRARGQAEMDIALIDMQTSWTKDSSGEYSPRVGSRIQALGSVKWYRALTVRDGLEKGLDFCPRCASDSGIQNLASVTSLTDVLPHCL